jgi:hypothetical protein
MRARSRSRIHPSLEALIGTSRRRSLTPKGRAPAFFDNCRATPTPHPQPSPRKRGEGKHGAEFPTCFPISHEMLCAYERPPPIAVVLIGRNNAVVMCGLTIGGHPITDDASRSNWWKLVTRRILRTSALMPSQSRTAPAPDHEAYAPR